MARVKYEARIGRPPQDRIAFAVPGEDSLSVGVQQAPGAQITAHGQQAVRFGIFRMRENRVGVQV